MAQQRYSLYSVQLNSGTFSGIKSWSYQPGFGPEHEGHDGVIYPDHASIMTMAPSVRIRSRDCAGVLGVTGVFYVAITDLKLFCQKNTNKGGRTSGSAHVKGVATSGIAAVRPISAKQGQATEIEIEIFLVSSDGITNPLVWTDSQALAGTPADVVKYTLGGLYIDDAQVTVQGWDLDPGVNIISGSDDGSVFPTFAYVDEIKPALSFQTHEMGQLVTYQDGASVAADAYLWKVAQHAKRASKSADENILFNITEGLAYCDGADLSHGSPGSSNYRILTTYDRTNPPVGLDVTSQIPKAA